MEIRAAILEAPRTELVVAAVELTDPGPGEVCVRMGASGICRSDLFIRDTGVRVELPAVMGHEGAGVVAAVGDGVELVSVGDSVVISWTPECGVCRFCRAGQPNRCRAMRESPGTGNLSRNGDRLNRYMSVASLAEYAVVGERQAVPIPSALPVEQACLIGCGVMTGFGAAVRTAEVKAGDSVVIYGCGGGGAAAIMGAQVAGATRILAVDPDPSKLALAKRLGATELLEATGREAVEAVQSSTGGGADVAIECVGRAAVMRDAVMSIRPGGMAVVVGLPTATDVVEMNPSFFLGEQTLKGSLYGSARPHEDFPMIAELSLASRIDLGALAGDAYPLEAVNEAIADMESGKIVRPVIRMGE